MNSFAFSNVQGCLRQRPLLAATRPRPLPSRAVAGNPMEHQASPPSTIYPSNGPYPPAPPPPTLVTGSAAFAAAVEGGVKKGNQSAMQTFKLGVLTGFYVGIGGLLMLSVGGNCAGLSSTNPGLVKLVTGLVGLPTALMIILIAGGDLYTGNTALLTAAVLEGKATFKQLLRSWFFSYTGNFVGCIIFAQLVLMSGLLAPLTTPPAVAVYKTSLPFQQAFVRAIFGNWMVCLAVWMANACTTMGGKCIATFLCIPAFVAMGLEHCIANMFIIPTGILHGAPVSWSHFFSSNLLPVTLGNTFAGAICVGAMHAFMYGKIGQPKTKSA